MIEINTFNELFAEAARAGLLLNNFCQLPNGVFRCNWRSQSSKRNDIFFDVAEHERPFDAVLAAFRIAMREPERIEFRDADGKPVAVMTDLFA